VRTLAIVYNEIKLKFQRLYLCKHYSNVTAIQYIAVHLPLFVVVVVVAI
jgi:ABC-type long-subunit fatty acid transport system fused permease/ATPase subunit